MTSVDLSLRVHRAPPALPLDPTLDPTIDPALDAASAVLVDAVRRLIHSLRGTSRTVEQQLGVHGAELLVLRKLAESSVASLGELAARTQTDPSTASVVVRGLVERGLVTRSVAPDDRRRTPIAITAAGRRVLHDAPEPAHARIARVAAPLGVGDVSALAAQIDALAGRLTAARSTVAGGDADEPDGRSEL